MHSSETPEHYGYRAGADRRWLVLCDHATHHIPAELGELGLPAEEIRRHIGWDLGALDLALAIAEGLQAPIFWHAWSRLVVDPNRAPDAADSVITESDGTPIPANQQLSAAERAERLTRYHQPYHDAIDAYLAAAQQAGESPILLAIHSMTPCLRATPRPRPMQASVLWMDDAAGQQLARPMLAWLRAQGLIVGDNDPYSCIELATMGYTLDRHGCRRQLPYLLIEVRQDLLEDPAAIQRWADRLIDGFRAVCGLQLPPDGTGNRCKRSQLR